MKASHALASSLFTLAVALGAAGCPGPTAPPQGPTPPPAPDIDQPVTDDDDDDDGDDAPVAASRPEVVTEFQLAGNTLVLPGPVAFETGTGVLLPDSEPALWTAVDYLTAKSYITLLRVEGHVGSGLGDGAQALSEERALAVARWLVANGVDCMRLIPVGFGDSKPIAEDTPEGRAQNTRIELVNAMLRERAIGGMPTDGGGRVAGDPCR